MKKRICTLLIVMLIMLPEMNLVTFGESVVALDSGNSIVSLTPETSGQIEFEIEGKSVKNLVENSDFSEGSEGWSTPYGSGSVVDGNYVQSVSELHSASRFVYGSISSTIGHRYFLYSVIMPKFSNNTFMQFGGDTSVIQPISDDWNEVYGIVDAENEWPLRIYHRTDTEYQVGQQIVLKPGVVVIDMTENDIEDYTEDQMLMIARNGLKGQPSSEQVTVKVTGKNLFDINGEVSRSVDPTYQTPPQNYVINNELYVIAGSSGYMGRGQVIDVKPNVNYTLSYRATENSYAYIMDANQLTITNRLSKRVGYLRMAVAGDCKLTFTSPSSGQVFISFMKRGATSTETPTIFSNIQLEEGDTKTTYEPYKSSEGTMNLDFSKNERLYSKEGLIYSSVTQKPLLGVTRPTTFAGERNTISVKAENGVIGRASITTRELPNTSGMTQDEINNRLIYQMEEQSRQMKQLNSQMQLLIQNLEIGDGITGEIGFSYDDNGNLKAITSE